MLNVVLNVFNTSERHLMSTFIIVLSISLKIFLKAVLINFAWLVLEYFVSNITLNMYLPSVFLQFFNPLLRNIVKRSDTL